MEIWVRECYVILCQGKMQFEASGGYLAAPGYFTVGKESGEITLLASVASDPVISFTVSKKRKRKLFLKLTS